MTLIAACHCGRATVRLARAPDYVSECNCSLCSKIGSKGVYYASGELEVTGAFDSYVREDLGEPFLTFLRCQTCGVMTHWEPPTEPPHDRVGVNARLLDPALLAGIEQREVDGASW